MGFPGSSVVKNPPAMQETQVQSQGQEDPQEKEMATHSSVFAWEIPRTEEPDGLQSMGSQRVRHNLAIKQQLQGRCALPRVSGHCTGRVDHENSLTAQRTGEKGRQYIKKVSGLM